jgi:hypothetical protein
MVYIKSMFRGVLGCEYQPSLEGFVNKAIIDTKKSLYLCIDMSMGFEP